MKTYICHYSPLRDRKVHFLNEISKSKLIGSDYEIVESEPDREFIDDHYDNREFSWRMKVDCLDYGSYIPFRELRTSDISLIYKHWVVLNKFLESDLDYALILEDDIILSDNFDEKIEIILNTTRNWDLIFLGDGCGLRIPEYRVKKGKYSYIKSAPSSKCTDSYLINRRSAKKVLDNFNKFSLPIDFELNYIMYINRMNVYWAEPPIVSQGSQNKLFNSTNGS